MATKAEYITKVLVDTMMQYVRMRAAEKSGETSTRRPSALDVDIPEVGVKLRLHLNKNKSK